MWNDEAESWELIMDYVHWRSGCSVQSRLIQTPIVRPGPDLHYCSKWHCNWPFLGFVSGYGDYCRSVPSIYSFLYHSGMYLRLVHILSIYSGILSILATEWMSHSLSHPCISRGDATTALENFSLSVLQHVMRATLTASRLSLVGWTPEPFSCSVLCTLYTPAQLYRSRGIPTV